MNKSHHRLREHPSNLMDVRPTDLVRKAFLKVKHSSSVNYRYLNTLLKQFSNLHSSDVVIAKSVQHSLFRLLYPLMWPNSNPGLWRAG